MSELPAEIGPFGDLLEPADRARLVRAARLMRYRRGDKLFLEGEPTRHAVLIEAGSVKIVRRRPDGADMILAVRGPNDLIGEMSAIDGTPRSASAIALGDVEVYVLDAPTFERFVKAHSNVAWMLIRSMAERQRDTDQRRLDQATSPVAYRVAAELLGLAERAVGLSGSAPDTFAVSQIELAEVVGATREAVAKSLGDLRRAGLIETGRRNLRIVDRAGLKELVGN